MSGLATANRAITWERKPRRVNLTAHAPMVDRACLIPLFPTKWALGDPQVDEVPDRQVSRAVFIVHKEGKDIPFPGLWGWKSSGVEARPTSLSACVSGILFG